MLACFREAVVGSSILDPCASEARSAGGDPAWNSVLERRPSSETCEFLKILK